MAAIGLAELSLDRDDPGAAVAVADRVLRQLPLTTKTQRTELARTLATMGRRDLAGREAAAALRVLQRTGASTLQRRAEELLDSLTDQSRAAGLLTARERQVVGLIARGMRDRDIADALKLSRHTVHRHVSNIYVKLGCSTRAAAVPRAAELEMP